MMRGGGENPLGGSALLLLVLALACIGSGVAVVEIENHSRTVTAHLEKLRRQTDHLEMERAQLELEQATLSQHGRVEQLAQRQFNMTEPPDYVIVAAIPPATKSAAPGAGGGS